MCFNQNKRNIDIASSLLKQSSVAMSNPLGYCHPFSLPMLNENGKKLLEVGNYLIVIKQIDYSTGISGFRIILQLLFIQSIMLIKQLTKSQCNSQFNSTAG